MKLPKYAEVPPLEGDGWKDLFDGSSLEGWTVVDFAGAGGVRVKEGYIECEMGAMLTGVNLTATNSLPRTDYEVVLDAMKVNGSDFFVALTLPVGEGCCSLIVGGWGGGVVGISCIDGDDASMNETTKFKDFEYNHWYRVRARVTEEKLECWIGKEKVVDVKLEGRRISVRPGEIEYSQPFGLAAWQTTTAFRGIKLRRLE